MKSSRPFVFSNFAMTADGKIAFANGTFTPFGSKHDLEHLYELRATADAIICGSRTVEMTGTILGNGGEKFRRLRLKNKLPEFPLRIIVSGSGSVDLNSNIFKKRFSPIIILTTERASKSDLKSLNAVSEVKVFGKREIDFEAALRWLKTKFSIKRLLCEGGGELHEALIRKNLLDEIHLTISPSIFGGKKAPSISGGIGFKTLSNAARFKLSSLNRNENELFAVFSSKK